MQLSFEIGIEDSCVLPTNLSRLLNTFTAHCASANPNSTTHSVPDSIIPTQQSGQLRLNKRGKSKRGNGISTLLPITRPAHRGSRRKSITVIYCVAKLCLQTSLLCTSSSKKLGLCINEKCLMEDFDWESNRSLQLLFSKDFHTNISNSPIQQGRVVGILSKLVLIANCNPHHQPVPVRASGGGSAACNRSVDKKFN